MTREELIATSRVPNTQSLFFLGCFESRVTMYAQQVRALNLVDAVIQSGQVRPRGRVAIIGGGAAGATAAAAFALGMPDLQGIDLYERKTTLLHLQVGSTHRYLHPHIYDWPDSGSVRAEADLPILDWNADIAGNVAEQILQQFNAIREKHSALRLHLNRTVTRVEPIPGFGCRVCTSSEPNGVEALYDVVILSIGFGYERQLTDRTYSYWDPQALAGPIRTAATESRILISGNGDGGLVDLMTVAFDGVGHRDLSDFITGYGGFSVATQKLQEIEREAWSGSSSPDIYAAYRDRVREILPTGMLLDVAERLRPDVSILLHTRDPHLFRRDTAVLNRVGAFLAIEADRLQRRGKIQVVTNAKFVGDPLDPEVRFDNGITFRPTYRFLRFGPDREANLSPFEDYASAWRAKQPTASAEYRPATPELEPLAAARFGKFRGEFRPAPTSERPNAPEGFVLQLTASAPDNYVWRSNVPLAEVCRIWGEDAPDVQIVCDMQVDQAGSLATAIARLAAHARACQLFSPDSLSWIDVLKTYTGRARPGPHVEVRFKMKRNGPTCEGLTHVVTLPREQLTERIHAALDLDVITRLNEVLRRSLHGRVILELGWPIEAGLRAELWILWQAWYRALEQSAEKRRRFLLLLMSIEDSKELQLSALVHAGPKMITQHLARSAILALAVASALKDRIAPSASFPGNLLGTQITAHATGVSWVNGRDLGPEIMTYPWTTTFVLLSELAAASEHLRAELSRLDKSEGETLRISDVSPEEEPIIIGGDYALRRALEAGGSAVKDYLQKVIESRANASSAYFE